MIARVAFEYDGEPAAAELAPTPAGDLAWACPASPVLERSLNTSLAVEDRSPARGDWLRVHVERIAEQLGGTAEFAPRPATPPGRVY